MNHDIKAEILCVFKDEPSYFVESGLKITQEPWENDTGVMTKANLYTFLETLLNYETLTNPVDCGIEADGCIYCYIYVDPFPASLEYQLYTSFGELAEKEVEEFEKTEVVTFRLQNSLTLGSTPKSAGVDTFYLSQEWVGDIYNEEGEVVDPPDVIITSDGKVSITRRVYASLRVKYTAVRHKYTLKVPKREDTDVDVFGAVVYGIWKNPVQETTRKISDGDTTIKKVETDTGGITWTELSPPPNADENAKAETTCGWYSNDSLIDEEDEEREEDIPEAPMVDKETIIDYCTQEITSENTYERNTPYSSSLMGF